MTTEKIGPGHICSHGIRWPWACDDCDGSMTPTQPTHTTTEVSEAMVEALKPFACIADSEPNTPDGASTMVNISRCRDARAALDKFEAAISTAPSGDGATEAATALVNFAWSAVVTDSTESAEHLNELVDNLRTALETMSAGDGDGLSEWAGWDQARFPWGETKHKDAVLEALFRGPWSVEDCAILIDFIDRTWTRRPAASSGETKP